MKKRTMKVTEAAEMLGISKGFVYNLVREGKIRSIKIGRRIIILVEEIETILKQ